MRTLNRNMLRGLALGVAMSALVPSQAQAQDLPETDSASAASEDSDEIVVTGTQIRGIAPAGTNVIGVGEQQIQASGSTTTNQVLATVPQLGNYFNQLPIGPAPVAGSNNSQPIIRPNLRGLPGAVTGGSAATLVLIDGHRVVGGGTQQVAVDPDVIAPDAIARVEALTDGGSAVYGSDALGGVLNFITRRDFEGIQARARYGFADEYQSFDGSLIAGTKWNGGGAYVSYSYSWHDAIYGADRDYVQRIDWATGIPTGRNCAAPTATVGAATYVVAGAGLTAAAPNACDASDNTTIYPAATLHNVFAKVTQDITDGITFDVSGLYANRKVVGNNGPLGLNGSTTGTVTLASTNPFFRPRTPGDTAAQTVRFNYGPVAGFRSMVNRTNLETWSVVPQLTAELGGSWQVRALASYGESTVSYENNVLNPGLQTAAVNAGTLNPYDIASTNSTVLAGILGGIEAGDGRNSLFDARVIVDGALLALPGGDVRVAVGAEYMSDKFKRRQTSAALVMGSYFTYKQNVKSLFGEVQVPIFSDANAQPFLQKVQLSLSARYDKYNDFGDTFNPKVGLDWEPVKGFLIRGNWGKSFTAPSPADQIGFQTQTATIAPGQFLSPPPQVPGVCGGSLPACTITGTAGVTLSNGAVDNLQPQTAKTWSIGVEIAPPPLEGLKISATYFKIDLKGSIGRPTGTNLTPFYNNFPELFIYRPTGQQLAAAMAASGVTTANTAFTIVNPNSTDPAIINSAGTNQTVGVFLDTRVRNFGRNWISGLDFNVSYSHPTGFGSVDASFAGILALDRRSQLSPLAAVTDGLTNASHLRFGASIGANIGNLRAQAMLNHSAGYLRADAGTAAAFGQRRVGAYDTVNLFFKYDVPADGLLKDLSFTLNVQNLLDSDPSLLKSVGANGYDVDHSQTIGRYFQFGVSKKF